MNWYLTSLLIYSGDRAEPSAQRCHYLIAADTHDSAFDKARELGEKKAKNALRFLGVADLLLINETPGDGTELSWSQMVLTSSELAALIQDKQRMGAFVPDQTNSSGWYLSKVVLCEVHDEGSHGDRLLVWVNSYLLSARDAEAAYARSTQIGNEQQDPSGSHKCDGEKAHWEFRGIEDIIPIRERPTDAALLWCDELRATVPELERMVPEKSQLTVFHWEAEKQERWGNRPTRP